MTTNREWFLDRLFKMLDDAEAAETTPAGQDPIVVDLGRWLKSQHPDDPAPQPKFADKAGYDCPDYVIGGVLREFLPNSSPRLRETSSAATVGRAAASVHDVVRLFE